MARKAKAQPSKDTEVIETVEQTPAVEEVIDANESKTTKPKKSTRNETKTEGPIRSVRYTQAKNKVEAGISYTPEDAIALVKDTATTKFIGSIEAHVNTNQKGLRGFVKYPHSTGKKKTILVFGNAAEQEGVIIGDDKSIDSIANGSLSAGKHFDLVIATPQYMSKLAKVAKILGPKGLMPNPKSGTVTDNPDKAIEALLGGQVEYKTEANAPIVHAIIGKANLESKDLIENLLALITTIGPNKITKLNVNATMGPSVTVKI